MNVKFLKLIFGTLACLVSMAMANSVFANAQVNSTIHCSSNGGGGNGTTYWYNEPSDHVGNADSTLYRYLSSYWEWSDHDLDVAPSGSSGYASAWVAYQPGHLVYRINTSHMLGGNSPYWRVWLDSVDQKAC